MKKACYIYRIDDITPGMDWSKFNRFMALFRKYHVVPLVGVVPDNRDPSLTVGKEEAAFWKILAGLWKEGLIEVAQHGYQHKYVTNGIQPFFRLCGYKPQSEFCGLSYMVQYEKIKAGKEILEKNGLPADIWMAPGHSFDHNTVKVLKKLKFKAVTDGIGVYPVIRKGIVFIPQQEWEPSKSRFGVRTICLHLNHANDRLYRQIEKHLQDCPDIVRFSSLLGFRPGTGHSLLNTIYKARFLLNRAKYRVRNLLQD